MTPFLIGLIFAYFLNPVKEKVTDFGVNKDISALLVTILFIVIFLLLSLTILPVLAKQFIILGEKVSSNSDSIKSFFFDTFNNIKKLYPDLGERLEKFVTDFSGSILSIATSIVFKAFHSGAAAINIIAVVLISPIALFYMLKDWSSIKLTIKNAIPHSMKKNATDLMNRIDITLSGYVKGQTYVCLILGLFFAVGLTIIGLESGFVLGMISGLLIFIPYLGAIFILVAILQFGTLKAVLLVSLVFLIGQLIESNFLTPYLIGKSVGLSPLWIIFAILAGGVLFGFVGVLLALPLTAIIGVVIKFGFEKYKKSKFYNAK